MLLHKYKVEEYHEQLRLLVNKIPNSQFWGVINPLHLSEQSHLDGAAALIIKRRKITYDSSSKKVVAPKQSSKAKIATMKAVSGFGAGKDKVYEYSYTINRTRMFVGFYHWYGIESRQEEIRLKLEKDVDVSMSCLNAYRATRKIIKRCQLYRFTIKPEPIMPIYPYLSGKLIYKYAIRPYGVILAMPIEEISKEVKKMRGYR